MRLEEIDIYNPDTYVAATPHEQFRFLREHDPVHWHDHPDGGGYWVLSRHADCVQVARDHAGFSAQRGFVLVDDLEPTILAQAQGQLLGMDPPAHGPIRRAVISRFTSKMLNELEPRIRSITREIMRDAQQQPNCDFAFDVAARLPTQVIAEMMGVPRADWDRFREWADQQTSGDDPEVASPEQQQQASLQMGVYGYELALEKQGKGGDDISSLLLNVEVEGHKVNPEEFASLFIQISVAGNETTRTLLSAGMLELIQRPEVFRELQAQSELIPAAVEEMLRYVCPLHYFRRTATRDIEIRGKQIKENDRVVMLYASANRDEEVFDRPDDFNIHRDPNPHITFGYGIHLCLGANLARLEARVFFEEFFRHFDGIELAGNIRRLRSNLVNGMKEMPVRLQPLKTTDVA